LGDLFPANRGALLFGLFMLGFPVGAALSFFFSGPIAQRWGWRAAMVVAAAPALLLIPSLIFLKEPARGASENHAAQTTKGSAWAVMKIPTLWWIILSGVFLNFNMYALGTFMPAFLSRVHGYTLARSGIATGFVYLIGGVAGGLLGGYLGDRANTARNARLRAACILAILAVPIATAGILQPASATLIALVCVAITFGALNTYYALVYSSIQDIVAPDQRGFTMSVYFMAMYLCGASFGPLFTGNLSDRLARQAMGLAGATKMTEAFRAIGLQQAMLVIPALSLALAVVLYFGSRTMNADAARRDARVLAMAEAV